VFFLPLLFVFSSIANYFETTILKALKNESVKVEKVFVKLHTGDPGEDGTANAAGEATRKEVPSWGTPTSGVLKSAAAVEWTNVSTSETYKYVSLWDASTAGNCLWVIQLEAEKAVSAGDSFKLAAEALSVSLD
jgi:hypothetical protein